MYAHLFLFLVLLHSLRPWMQTGTTMVTAYNLGLLVILGKMHWAFHCWVWCYYSPVLYNDASFNQGQNARRQWYATQPRCAGDSTTQVCVSILCDVPHQRNHLGKHFPESIPVIKWQMTFQVFPHTNFIKLIKFLSILSFQVLIWKCMKFCPILSYASIEVNHSFKPLFYRYDELYWLIPRCQTNLTLPRYTLFGINVVSFLYVIGFNLLKFY